MRLRTAPVCLVLFTIAVAAAGIVAAGAPSSARDEWRSRTVFQLLTDRFATDECWGHHGDQKKYMGGTWNGMVKEMDYITNLGFDAIWMSPITAQGSDAFGMTGYAGYWPSDFYEVNPAFGTREELQRTVQHYQSAGLAVLFDLVINHVGYGDFSDFSPFNKSTDFHDCNGCFTLHCAQDPSGMFASPPLSGHSYEHCKLSGLPDLNHSDPTVLQRMRDWQAWLHSTFKPDGLRYDAATNSLPSFVAALAEAVPVWTVAEIYLEDPLNDSQRFIAEWLHSNITTSAFSFPMQKALRLSLRERQKDMRWLNTERERWLALTGDRVHDTANFLDNHDLERWLAGGYNDYSRLMNGLAYVLFAEGIPFIFYGTEAGFTEDREPLWFSNFATDNPLWLFLRVAIHYRKLSKIWDAGLGKTIHVDEDTLVMARGDFVIVLTSVGTPGPAAAQPDYRTLRGVPARLAGQTLRNIHNPQDKLEVARGGVGVYRADERGQPQIFYAGPVADPQSFYMATPATQRWLSTVFVVFAALLVPVVLVVLVCMHCWVLWVTSKSRRNDCDAASIPSSTAPDKHDMFVQNGGRAELASSNAGAGGGTALGRAVLFLAPLLRLRGGTGTKRAKGAAVSPPLSLISSNGTRQNTDSVIRSSTFARSPTQSRLRQASMQQALASSGSTMFTRQHPQQRRSSVASSGTGRSATSSERFEAFAGFSSVFKHAGAVSAVDLAQGLVAEEYAALQDDFTGSRAVGSATGVRGAAKATAGLTTLQSGQLLDSQLSPEPRTDIAPGLRCVSGRPSSFMLINQGLRVPPAPGVSTAVSSAGSSTLGFNANTVPILHVALEYAIPHLGYDSQLMFGGLGMVVATFLKQWPGPLGLISPLYAACYGPIPNEDAAAAAAAADGGSSADGLLRPTFIPAGQLPLLEMTVDVAGRQLPVEVWKVEATAENGQQRVFYLVQSDLFRHRLRGQIYSFEDEDEMLTWLAVFNEATAAVVVQEGVTHMQLHDYHGGLSLMYIPEALRPALLYIAHNAHYNATFPIPTPARRIKIYEHLGLNAEQAAPYVEHNGSLDMLRTVVSYLRRQQHGHGVVAVSPRYAQQIKDKLSVFWELQPLGRPRNITGILNSLDMSESLAASGMSLEQVLAVKAEAKKKLQETYCLAVGEEFVLLVFIGRITHQKGCDIIAEAAPYMMAQHPRLQLVMVGPTGDVVGAAASAKLAQLALQYPDRMYCPQDLYVAGDEKNTILTATDFCLIPSRFEPCGLVDVEFGWNGALLIGHDTGGLGKMPGVYFKAQASHLSHLARKLEAAVDEALELSLATRHKMMADALAKRFPADEMFASYALAWANIDRHHWQARKARHNRLMYLHDHATFFANKWARLNKGAVAAAAPAAAAPGANPSRSAALAAATAGAGAAAAAAGPLGGPVMAVAGRSASPDLFSQEAGRLGGGAPSRQRPVWLRNFPAAQQLSNYLLVILQYWALGPGVMLMSFLLLQEILVQFRDKCGLHTAIDDMFLIIPKLFRTVPSDNFIPRLIVFFFLSVVFAPGWFWLASRLRPASYIRMAAVLVFLSWVLVFVTMFTTLLMPITVMLVALTNLVGSPLMSMGFLGEDGIEVSEVGRKMLAISETAKFSLLSVGMLLAGTAVGPIPHAVVTGVCMLLSAAVMVWFCHPMALSQAYEHLTLTYQGQWGLLKHLSCFWITLLAAECDVLGFMLTGFLVIATSSNLDLFAEFQAVAFGCCVAAVLWNYKFLQSRAAELRLNASVLLLAAMPFYEFFKGMVVMGLWARGMFPPGGSETGSGRAILLGVCGMIDAIMGGRSSVLGLAGFVTLPSREIVSIWQVLSITVSAASALLIIGLARVANLHGATTSCWLLFGLVGGIEVVRAGCMALMVKAFPKENLSAP